MKTRICLGAFSLTALVAVAQGPGPGGHMGRPMGGPGMMGGGPGMMMTRTPVAGAPFSAVQTTVSQEKFADGNVVTRQETSKVYRDSQGRMRVERSFTPPGSQTAQTMISIFDPVAGYSHMLNPADQTAHKMALPKQAQRAGTPAPREDANANVKTEDLGTQAVNGVMATGTRVTRTIAAGAIGNAQPIVTVREIWTGTALKVPVQIKSTDPRFGSTTMNLSSVTTAEPDAALFQVPATYTVPASVRPGAMLRRGQQRHTPPQQQ